LADVALGPRVPDLVAPGLFDADRNLIGRDVHATILGTERSDGAIHVPVRDAHRETLTLDEVPQLLHQCDRAVASPRAADGHREIGFALFLVAGQEVGQEVAESGYELAAFGLLDHELPHGRRPTILRLQAVDKERIG